MSGEPSRDARRLRERQLQVEHGLSIQESEIMAALEAGERPAEIARRMGIKVQSVTTARDRAAAKMRHQIKST